MQNLNENITDGIPKRSDRDRGFWIATITKDWMKLSGFLD